MSINSRNKGAAFERQIAKALVEDLNLKNPVKSAEPRPDWWDQVLRSSKRSGLRPALVYKFNNRPIKVRILAHSINKKIKNDLVTLDLLWPDFVEIIIELFQEDIELHEQSYQV